MEHLGTKNLETRRLILRPFKIEDQISMYENWASDERVVKFLTWPAHDSIEITKGILTEWISNYKDLSFYQWAISLKENREIIGSISVVEQDDAKSIVQIGYCIGSQWWGQGFMTETLKEVIRFFFEEVEIDCIESKYDTRNIGSGRVMEKAGLSYEREFKNEITSSQGPGTVRLMNIKRDQWMKGV